MHSREGGYLLHIFSWVHNFDRVAHPYNKYKNAYTVTIVIIRTAKLEHRVLKTSLWHTDPYRPGSFGVFPGTSVEQPEHASSVWAGLLAGERLVKIAHTCRQPTGCFVFFTLQ